MLAALLSHNRVKSIAYSPGTGEVVVREDVQDGKSAFSNEQDLDEILPPDPLAFSRRIQNISYVQMPEGSALACLAALLNEADQRNLLPYAVLINTSYKSPTKTMLGCKFWTYQDVPPGSCLLLCGNEEGASWLSATAMIGGHYAVEP